MIANALQICGLALIAVAGFLLAPWLGIGLAGVGLLLLGLSLEH